MTLSKFVLPNISVYSSEGVTTQSSAASGTVSGLALSNETIFHDPGVGISSLVFALPTSGNSRAGQIKTFLCRQNIDSFTINSNGNLLIGDAVSNAAAYDGFSWQCIQPGTWMRLA